MVKYILSLFIAISGALHAFAGTPIVVAKDGSGNFTSIQEAINSLPGEDGKTQRVILIKKGVYNEKIFIDKNFITLQGESPENTIVSISLSREQWRCDNKDDYGTATINLRGSDITLENLTFINSFGKDNPDGVVQTCAADSSGKKTIRSNSHQMALRSFGTTRLIVNHCIFRAYGGDTVSPWNTDEGMFYFKDCEMEGGVDFYCPRGWALAEHCTFICHDKNAAIWHDGSKYPSSKTVLLNCTFKGDDGFKLGRYHRDAQFYLLHCTFPKNMADVDIYLVPTGNKLQWGRRVYYYHCKKEDGKDFAWYSNNLPSGFDMNEYSTGWVYDFKWNPAAGSTNNNSKSISTQTATQQSDAVADNMLLYQRKNGGWPKHFPDDKKVDYKHVLTDAELKDLQSGYEEGIDATIDNEATTKEMKYLVKAYKKFHIEKYLQAATRGVEYLLKAQYANGGWPQYYPDFRLYRSQITYNDNAMMNVTNVLQDIVERKNDFDVIDAAYIPRCQVAINKSVDCILKTQVKQKGVLTVWCAQYNAKTLVPEMARKFELASLSGAESVGIVRFLMRQPNPTPEIKAAVKAAVQWFDKVKITGYNVADIKAPNEPSGKDRVVVKDDNHIMWARFYDLDTNEPFFAGRDSQPQKTLAAIENERRVGYAWYGTWPEKLINEEYPKWVKMWGVGN
ncbi:MAG: pectate lyase [Bacteroidetes bacterium]|nr:pectate lyase [Bacteroidota bacterium]